MKLLYTLSLIFLFGCNSTKTTFKVHSDTTQSVFYTDSLHVIIFYEDGYKDYRIKKQ